jgi:hypothetical protein
LLLWVSTLRSHMLHDATFEEVLHFIETKARSMDESILVLIQVASHTEDEVQVSRTSPKGCPKHHGHKGDPGVTPGTCGAGGEKDPVILVWVRALGVGNASHPQRLGVMRVSP